MEKEKKEEMLLLPEGKISGAKDGFDGLGKLKEKLFQLPVIALSSVAKDGQIIEGRHGDCSYQSFKVAIPESPFIICVLIIVTKIGTKSQDEAAAKSQDEVVSHFIKLFGFYPGSVITEDKKTYYLWVKKRKK